jgi:hypothetical protein
MPRGANKDSYADGKIYRLVATGTDQVYIGSTCGTLKQRHWHHNYTAAHPESQKQTMACKLYEEGRTVAIELIEAFPCESRDQLLARERHWLENTPTAINRNTPGGLGWKAARERRKEEFEEYMDEYRAIDYVCECGAEIKRCEKARHQRSAKHQALLLEKLTA